MQADADAAPGLRDSPAAPAPPNPLDAPKPPQARSPSTALQQGRANPPAVTLDTTSSLSSRSSSATNKLQKKPRAQPSSSSSSSKPHDPPRDKDKDKTKDTQHKKKRRFFGLGGSDSSSSPSSSSHAQQTSPTSSSTPAKGGFFGRSLSTRSRPLSYQGTSSSTSPSLDKHSWLSPSAPSRPDPIAEESSSPPTGRARPANRHSIAGLPLAATHDPDAPQQDLPSPDISPLASPAAFTTFASQSPDADEVGSKPSSAWSERSKGSAAQHYPSYNTHFLNISDSRPSSRQSIEPSSPLQAHGQYIAYHPHKAVSQSSVNKLDISRDPSPLLQQPPQQRLASGQSTATGGSCCHIIIGMTLTLEIGNYGSSLDPDSASRKQHKQLGMVQNNGAEGRATPPPSKSKEDLASLDFPQLLGKHEELSTYPASVRCSIYADPPRRQVSQGQEILF